MIRLSLNKPGYNLDPSLSGNDKQVIVNRGIQLNSKKNSWKVLARDLAIGTGIEKFNPCFRNVDKPSRKWKLSRARLGKNSRLQVILWMDMCPSM